MPPLLIVLTKWDPLADPSAKGYWCTGSDGQGTIEWSDNEIKGESLRDFEKALELSTRFDKILTIGLYISEKSELKPDLLFSYDFRKTNHPKYPYNFQTILEGEINQRSDKFRQWLRDQLNKYGLESYSKRLYNDYFILIEAAPQELIDDITNKKLPPKERKKERKLEYKCLDGHLVKSRAERNIDDWLYEHGYLHAYEYRLPFMERDYYCDFYIPDLDVYIEYWGISDEEKYKQVKENKKKLYNKYNLNLIELEESDLEDLDRSLGRRLIEFERYRSKSNHREGSC